LYNSVGWSSYTAQPAILNQAIINSLDVITAWQNQRLIGLIRTVGDGQTILYIQDLLVAPGFQQQGIGTKLM
jgi:ribosomal protein S18 acetylase RimI-like enzyme